MLRQGGWDLVIIAHPLLLRSTQTKSSAAAADRPLSRLIGVGLGWNEREDEADDGVQEEEHENNQGGRR